jgi:hypothetical protein
MLPDEEIGRLVREGGDLPATAKSLVRAANRRGGEDNITVVLVRFAADEADEATGARLEDTLSGLETTSALAQQTAAYAAGAPPAPTRPAAPVPPGAPAPQAKAAQGPSGLRLGRGLLILLAAVTIVLAVLAAALWGVSRANFVGVAGDGHVVVYQGLPWDLVGGVKLYRERYVSRLLAEQLSPAERAALLDHELVDYDEARSKVRAFEREGVP